MTLKRRIAPLNINPLTVETLQKRRADALQRAKYFDRLARAECNPYQKERYLRRAARAREVVSEYQDAITKLKTLRE